jgi:hypothetical protein
VDDTLPLPEHFLAAIGRLSLSWAMLETGLDYMIIVIHHKYGGSHLGLELPISLKRKLAYLNAAFSSIPQLASHKTHYVDLRTKIKAAADGRHNVIHGIVIKEMAAERPAEVELVRFLVEGDRLKERKVTLTATDVLGQAGHARDLAFTLLTVTKALVDPILNNP